MTGDVVDFVHTQRFRNDDGDPVAPGSSIRNLKTVDPHGTQPTLLRRMREGVLVRGSEDELKEAVRLAHEATGLTVAEADLSPERIAAADRHLAAALTADAFRRAWCHATCK
eukprot:gene53941-49882_t